MQTKEQTKIATEQTKDETTEVEVEVKVETSPLFTNESEQLFTNISESVKTLQSLFWKKLVSKYWREICVDPVGQKIEHKTCRPIVEWEEIEKWKYHFYQIIHLISNIDNTPSDTTMLIRDYLYLNVKHNG